MQSKKVPDLTLTAAEVQKIDAWLSENDFSLDRGYFTLEYDFWMQGPDVEIWWHPDSAEDPQWVALREGMGSRQPEQDVTDIEIDGVRVPLVVPDDVGEAWLEEARARTEAEVNAGCEPSGASFSVKVRKSGVSM